MPIPPNKTIVLTGPDGSGKSTLASLLNSHFSEMGAAVAQVTIWDAIHTTNRFSSKAEVLQHLDMLKSLDRTKFILESFKRAIDWSSRQPWDVRIIDGHWYKYAAVEMALGQCWATIKPMLIELGLLHEKIDHQFYLQISPKLALKRKESITPYESGYSNKKEVGFVSTQLAQKFLWKNIESEFGPWIYLNSKDSVGKNLEKVLAHVAPEISTITPISSTKCSIHTS